ncbi:NAD-dependent succinate-semialdehyde dehydrogenase (plasmid) [Leisingera sp. M527]|uniref:NAD-dependent succinate-semialdehyde dehydrogenase n=1 Tax=Leisingera sp. M527 TaxID=2867014 RepID=UPI0021A75741|nr:NAD-dependent succinate-semialdehyde dehydrogenase [Leisingera sp. M527]UWQ35623.1 NAD-dependent succinate-semialdehyde dehydrogenase [Leisingera sp. M527]
MNHSSQIDLLLDDSAKAAAQVMLDRVVSSTRQQAGSGTVIDVHNPSTGEVIGSVANEGAKGIEEAVEQASQALRSWSALLPRERSAIMMRWHRLIQENADGLAALMTLEQGKPVDDAKGEIAYAASFIEWYAEEGNRLYADTIPSHLPGKSMKVAQQPVGVVGAITPWNFPSAMLTRKAAAAMAAGCPVVSIPSKVTPFSALALDMLAREAGVPEGVFRVVTGHARVLVSELCSHTAVRAVSYTGSTEVGRNIMEQCSATVKRVSLELGGHAPFIVFSDADFEAAVQGAIAAKYQTGGQDCLAANRIYVARCIYDQFATRFTEEAQKLVVGDGFGEGVNIGPLASNPNLRKSMEHVEDAVAKGARLMCGGNQPVQGGLFFTPTVLADVTPNMRITYEETFGPVAALIPFDDEETVIKAANDTEYGLVAYAYTSDVTRVQTLPSKLEYGMVAVNTAKLTGAPIPFGGVKQSGNGREGSRLGILEYIEPQYVCIQA